jgi:hypothetical protein
VDEQKSLEEQIERPTCKKRELRQRIFEIEERIEERRDGLLDKPEACVQQVVAAKELFAIGGKKS